MPSSVVPGTIQTLREDTESGVQVHVIAAFVMPDSDDEYTFRGRVSTSITYTFDPVDCYVWFEDIEHLSGTQSFRGWLFRPELINVKFKKGPAIYGPAYKKPEGMEVEGEGVWLRMPFSGTKRRVPVVESDSDSE